MPVAIITGAGGLIGSESVEHFIGEGFDVIGVENDMRASFFGPEASTSHVTERLVAEHPEFRWENADIRDRDAIDRIFARARRSDRAGRPHRRAALARLGRQRPADRLRRQRQRHAQPARGRPRATAPTRPSSSARPTRSTATRRTGCRWSTLETRLELPESHPYYEGIDTSMSIDASTHSLFGVSKVAADLLVQEYGRYFDMPTVCFRGGCLTGPQHAGAQLHGFLAYLMKCTVTGTPYTVFGYDGKQVRDNIHSADLIAAFDAFRRAPRAAAVYNIGGGRVSNCSMLEAIEICERDRRPRAELGDGRGAADRRPPLVDLRPGAVPGRLPGLAAALRGRGHPARDPRAERRALDGDRGMKLSVVIPAHNEEGSIGATVEGVVAALEREEIDYEIVVVDDGSEDGTGSGRRSDRRRQPASPRATRSHYERASGWRSGPASTSSTAMPSRS